MKAFFRAARPLSQRDDWSLDDRARFNGLSEGYLLQFLSENKGALTTARRLGFTLAHSKPHQSLPTAAGGKAADATPRQRAADVTPAVSKSPRAPQPTKATRHAERPKSGTPPHAKPHAPTVAVEDEAGGGSMQDADKASTGNSKQRRAAKRSARHHALQLPAQQPHTRKIGPWLVMIFWVRLRRRARLRRALEDLEELRDEMLDSWTPSAKTRMGPRRSSTLRSTRAQLDLPSASTHPGLNSLWEREKGELRVEAQAQLLKLLLPPKAVGPSHMASTSDSKVRCRIFISVREILAFIFVP